MGGEKRVGAGRRMLCLMMVPVLLLLSACSRENAVPVPEEPSVTLGPAAHPYEAPASGGEMAYEAPVNLYLPSRDGTRLLARQETLRLTRGERNARTVLTALFGRGGDDATRSLAGPAHLTLYGANPVETSGNVCTVNLASSAHALEYDEIYTVGLAVAATLEGVSGIRYVNMLINDQAISYDVAGNLPSGSMTARPGEELPLLWEQMTARRTALGDSPSAMPLSATATIYFPTADGAGFLPEARNLTFPGQTPAQLAAELLTAMSSGPQYVDGCAPMPDINELLLFPPQVSELPEGGRLITLYFPLDLEEELAGSGLEPACFVASIVWTLSTFIPSIGAVRIYKGSTLMTGMNSDAFGNQSFENGLIRRRQFRDGLRDRAGLLLARDGRLVRVRRSVPAAAAEDPRTVLTLMMDGPDEEEQALRLRPVLPPGLDGTDILGIALENGVLLVNLSPRFEREIRRLGGEEERLCCYAMVNALCGATGAIRVRFFWLGEQKETLAGTVWWDGDFLVNHALDEQGGRGL